MRSLFHAAFFPLVLTAATFAAEPGTGLPKKSPFLPPSAVSTPTTAASENMEFAGVSSVGKNTDLIFYDKTAKKNHWIGVGETKEGISVITYDARHEQAVVKVNGAEKTLSLRKGTGPVNAGGGLQPAMPGFNAPAPAIMPAMVATPAPNPVAMSTATAPASAPSMPAVNKPEGPVTSETQAKQETEARMLVSDLLEIGMAQRKAYEDAQRRAGSGIAPNPTDPATPSADPSAPKPQ